MKDDAGVWQDPRTISNLSDGQEIALVILVWCSSILSMMGSILILRDLFWVPKRKKKQSSSSSASSSHRRPAFARILGAMALWDIVFTFQLCWSPLLVPADTSQQVWALGNDATCQFLGFWTSLAFAAVYYNGTLSLYYVLTITGKLTDAQFAKYVEPWCHLLNNGYPLVTAIVGAFLGVYSEHEIGPGCWVDDYPRNCGTDHPEQSGETCLSPLLAWIFAGLPTFVTLLVIVVNNAILIWHVNRRMAASSSSARSTSSQRSLKMKTWKQNSLQSTADATASTMAQSIEPNHQQQAQSQNKQVVRAIAHQAFLYVAAFCGSLGWGLVLRIIEGQDVFWPESDAQFYWLYVLSAICLPLQGFWNWLIYMRPRYLRQRRKEQQQQSAIVATGGSGFHSRHHNGNHDNHGKESNTQKSPYLEDEHIQQQQEQQQEETAAANLDKSSWGLASTAEMLVSHHDTTAKTTTPSSETAEQSTRRRTELKRRTSWGALNTSRIRDDPSRVEEVVAHDPQTRTAFSHQDGPLATRMSQTNLAVGLDRTSWAILNTSRMGDDPSRIESQHHDEGTPRAVESKSTLPAKANSFSFWAWRKNTGDAHHSSADNEEDSSESETARNHSRRAPQTTTSIMEVTNENELAEDEHTEQSGVTRLDMTTSSSSHDVPTEADESSPSSSLQGDELWVATERRQRILSIMAATRQQIQEEEKDREDWLFNDEPQSS
eukprot:CAMPEP_0172442398 /NCGR_PEP_ID=MMETSP1065-20121228/2835_1 /TAXON_ID=265537 /ORGANISM="Amphiprora paludosa, Strain CCMP125" /LENGTH=716 /DNA_ID=CAMNT_0013192239 /DNA_START=151 /DNA_END=2301 /DNA_ORIENTATION=+